MMEEQGWCRTSCNIEQRFNGLRGASYTHLAFVYFDEPEASLSSGVLALVLVEHEIRGDLGVIAAYPAD